MPSMRHSHLKNSSRSTAALNLFFGSYIDFVLPERRALRLPAPQESNEELYSLRVGGPLPLFEIYQRELSCLLFQLQRLAGRLPWLQCAALIGLLAVTLDRCSVNTETAGCFALGDAFF